MKSIDAAKSRMGQFPRHLVTACKREAIWYAKCMTSQEPLKHGACNKEFEALKACIKKAGKKVK